MASAGKRLRPEQPQHLREVAAEQRADLFEHFLRAAADLHQPEIGVDHVNAEWRLIDEIAEGVVCRLQALLGTGALEAQVGARGDFLQQLGIAWLPGARLLGHRAEHEPPLPVAEVGHIEHRADAERLQTARSPPASRGAIRTSSIDHRAGRRPAGRARRRCGSRRIEYGPIRFGPPGEYSWKTVAVSPLGSIDTSMHRLSPKCVTTDEVTMSATSAADACGVSAAASVERNDRFAFDTLVLGDVDARVQVTPTIGAVGIALRPHREVVSSVRRRHGSPALPGGCCCPTRSPRA